MSLPDLVVLFGYFALLQMVGFLASRAQRSTSDFFSGQHNLPWWAVSASIVAAETSSLTFISIPGLAYTGNLAFMQLALGYVVGRVVVAFVFLPAYFRGNLDTVYAFLEQRFSVRMRNLAAIIFQVTRLLGTGVRLYATALPLSLITGWSMTTSILVFSILTLPYIFSGGIRSGIWVEFTQAGVYLAGALAAVFILHGTGASLLAAPAKLQWISFGFEKGFEGFLTQPFHLAAGIIGGALLAISSHGTDQLIVQKALACRNLRDAQKAMIVSGILVDLQFLLFLLIGVWLFVFFNGRVYPTSDAVFPDFIVNHLPRGVIGLVLAAIFATGQSTLSATVTSLASSTMLDLLPGYAKGDEVRRLRLSRLFIIFWMSAIVLVSFMFTDQKSPVVVIALKIATIVAGGTIGLYILGFFRVRESAALAGFIASLAAMALVAAWTPLAWTWFVPAGLVVFLAVSLSWAGAVSFRRRRSHVSS